MELDTSSSSSFHVTVDFGKDLDDKPIEAFGSFLYLEDDMFKHFIYNSNAGLDGILVHPSPGDNDPSIQSHNDMNMTSYYLHTQW